MKRILISTAVGISAAMLQVPANAADAKAAQDEMKEHGCVKCHDMAVKKVGPSFKDVSAKYKGKKVDEAIAGMKGKPVHKATLQKAADSSLKTILEWVLEQ